MSLSVEYRGYTIRYSENLDAWDSDAFDNSKYSAPTLSKAKEKIDTLLREVRKKAALECFEIEGGYQRPYQIRDATVIEYEGPKIDGSSWSGKPRYVADHTVGVVAARGGKRPARQNTHLSSLIYGTVEDQLKLDEANRLLDQAKALEAKAKELIAAIPRVRLEDIQELVRISGIDPTGGLKS